MWDYLCVIVHEPLPTSTLFLGFKNRSLYGYKSRNTGLCFLIYLQETMGLIIVSYWHRNDWPVESYWAFCLCYKSWIYKKKHNYYLRWHRSILGRMKACPTDCSHSGGTGGLICKSQAARERLRLAPLTSLCSGGSTPSWILPPFSPQPNPREGRIRCDSLFLTLEGVVVEPFPRCRSWPRKGAGTPGEPWRALAGPVVLGLFSASVSLTFHVCETKTFWLSGRSSNFSACFLS